MTTKRRILIVDDEKPLLLLYQEILGDQDYEVKCVNSSAQALALLRSEQGTWSLMLTDFTMPQMNGYELVDQLRQFDNELPVIICSGYSEKLDENEQQRLKISCFLQKPVDHDLLIDTIAAQL